MVFYNCSSKNQIVSRELVEETFVTKKDARLYNDTFEKIVIDEIPAFIKVKALEKIILLDNSENEKTYYKTIFNNKEGWVEKIFLSNTNNSTSIKEKTIKTQRINDNPTKRLNTEKVRVNTSSERKGRNRYYVQLASFKNEINAKRLFNIMKEENFSLSLEKINSSKGLYFRVITEIYQTKKEAESISIKIKEKNSQLNPIIKTNFNKEKTKISYSTKKTKNGKTEYYTIQLSSFENKKAAEKLAKKMTESGYPSKVTEAWVKGKTWFRVQHGEYKMIAVAKQVSIKLKNEYKFNPWISNIYK